jgi:dTDP-4-amino-4,6-dideoxygalactose transaminase
MSIPYGRQDISEADIAAVVAVLRSDFLTQGPVVSQFERSVAQYCGVQHAVAVNSATSALHIACLALGVGPGDCVWTSAITFVASANCALYCGASVDFVDINPRTYNMSVEQLAEKLLQAEKKGNLPKVVIPVHLCGQPCDMEAIYALSAHYGFKIIEDASHAIGGKYKDETIGNCRYSDITIFSFHPVKIITSGEGGIAVTSDASLARRMQLLRSHGISNAPDEMTPRPVQEIWNYQQTGLGFNYRMTDIQAALGLSQMQRLDEFVSKRHALAARYNERLAGLQLDTPLQHPDSYSAYHLYVIRIDQKAGSNKTIYQALHQANVLANLHYIPVYRHPYYESLGFKQGYCDEAEKYFSSAITLPLFPSLEYDMQEKVIEALADVIQEKKGEPNWASNHV